METYLTLRPCRPRLVGLKQNPPCFIELRGYELEHVDDWRPKTSKIDAQRRAAGATSLLSLTIVILQGEYEEQEANRK
jgi:hypothetical protein